MKSILSTFAAVSGFLFVTSHLSLFSSLGSSESLISLFPLTCLLVESLLEESVSILALAALAPRTLGQTLLTGTEFSTGWSWERFLFSTNFLTLFWRIF